MSDKQPGTSGMEAPVRLGIGINVAIAVLASAALLVAVNWFASLKHVRKDVASLAHYGLSPRTKSVLSEWPNPIQVSVLYRDDPEDEKQQDYLSRLMDYCDEMQRFSPRVGVTRITSDMQREKLVAELTASFGGEAGKHQEALAAFKKLAEEISTDLTGRLAQAQSVMGEENWLGSFPLFASIVTALRADLETIEKTDQEIAELVPASGIPKYGDAADKGKATLGTLKDHFTAISTGLSQLADLADESVKADSKHIAEMRRVAARVDELTASLRQTVGGDSDPIPENPSVALKAFADRGVQVGGELDELVRPIDEFAKKFPMVTQHPSWSAEVKMGPLMVRQAVADVLEQLGQSLRQVRLGILGIIDGGKPDELKSAIEAVRQNMKVLEKNAGVCKQLLNQVADGLSRIDPASRGLLDEARSGTWLKNHVEPIAALVKQIEELPKLKLGSIADELRQDNIVVVQTESKVRVVGFAEMFPATESAGGPSGKDAELPRTFNGDSAMSSAILALTREHPFATVVITSYEPEQPPRQFGPAPPQSRIPSANLAAIRRRLEGANFKVVDWNMAKVQEPPKAEEGTENVYILLPPPPATPPSPFGPPPSEETTFGEAQRGIVKKLLDEDARVVFLAAWEVMGGGFFGPPSSPPYGYDPLLQADWGVHVENGRRVISVELDRSKPDSFGINLQKFNYMPVVGFTEHPAGAPLRGTRFLIADACPIKKTVERPDGVSLEPIVTIPGRENYIAPDINDLIEIVDELRTQESGGRLTMNPGTDHGPFDLAIGGVRSSEGKSKGKMVLISFGSCYRDDYFDSPVMADSGSVRFDPPPVESADLLINSIYWLQGQTQWIARGPAPVPRIGVIETEQMNLLRGILWVGWPLAVFAPGILLWYVRRK